MGMDEFRMTRMRRRCDGPAPLTPAAGAVHGCHEGGLQEG
nr:L711 [uncultured bacterium]